jgi:vitamin B12 transporter
VELQATVNPTGRLTLAANYTLTDTEDKSPGSPTYGQELLRRPKHAANVSLTYRWSSALSASAAARYAGPSFDNNGSGQVVLGGYTLVDLKISYALRDRFELYGRVENVADKHHETTYQYGTYGRVGFAGVRATF